MIWIEFKKGYLNGLGGSSIGFNPVQKKEDRKRFSKIKEGNLSIFINNYTIALLLLSVTKRGECCCSIDYIP